MPETKNNIKYAFAVFAVIIAIIISCAAIFYITIRYFGCDMPAYSEAVFSADPKNFGTVIIDAGHGGKDAGASSKSGILEKDLNLKIAFKIGKILESQGMNVIYTRKEDELLQSKENLSSFKLSDLKGRVEMASQYPDSIFLSIHQNALPIENCKGLQVFYSPNDPISKVIAKKIQDENKIFLQRDNKREIKKAGSNIFILDRISSPAVLIECGFLSNAEEAEILDSDEYQNKLAFIIAESILSYKNP